MDRNLIYAKTPSGEEATRQRTRVVQRNLRMVLLQVDGQVTVEELIAKVGNEALVTNALRELEKGGYICLAADAPSVWELSKAKVKSLAPAKKEHDPNSPISAASILSAASDFSGFGDESSAKSSAPSTLGGSQFSTFGKPILPALDTQAVPPPSPPAPSGPGLGQRIGASIAGLFSSFRRPPSRSDEERETADLKPLRKINVVRLLTTSVAVLLALLGAVLFLYPYNSYRPDVEKALSDALMVPVRIAKVDARFLPTPGLVLTGVELGNSGQAHLGEIVVPQLLSLAMGGSKPIREAVVSNARVSADFLNQLAVAGKQRSLSNAAFQLDHLTLKQMVIVLGDLAMPALDGEFVMASGRLEKISLDNAPRTLHVDLFPEASGVRLQVQGYSWRPGGEESPLAFSSIQAKGSLQAGRLSLSDVDINTLNGTVVGNGALDWSGGGMVLAGEAQLSRISIRQLSTTLQAGLDMDGDLSGALHFGSSASQWAELWDKREATLAMTVGKGAFNGADLGEAARRGAGSIVRGGSTKFERIFGTVKISAQSISSTDLDLDAGLLQARGRFAASRDKLVEANLQVQIKSSVMPLRVAARVYGTLPVLETVTSK